MLIAKSINISFSCKNQAKYSSTAFLNLDLKTSYVIFDQSKGKANFIETMSGIKGIVV